MGGGLESRSVGRVYAEDGAVRLSSTAPSALNNNNNNNNMAR